MKMNTIKEIISIEEIQGLVMGKTIDFFEDENLKLQIDGTDVKDFCNSDVENLETEYIKQQITILERELKSREKPIDENSSIEEKQKYLRELLTEDILDGFDVADHWDVDLIDNVERDLKFKFDWCR